MSWLTELCINCGLIGLIFGFGFGFIGGILAQYHRFGRSNTRKNDTDEHAEGL